MKILQAIIAFIPSTFGGIKNHLFCQAKEMVKQGHSVDICTTNAYSRNKNNGRVGLYDVDGMNVRYFKRLKPYSAFFAPSLIFYLRKNIKQFDLLHLQDFRTFPNLAAYYYANKYDIPYVLSAGGSVPRGRGYKTIKKWIFDLVIGNIILNNAARLIALSEVEVEQYKDAGIPTDKIAIVHNGVVSEDIPATLKRGTFKEKYGIAETFLISFVGRIHEIKGLDFLARSFAVFLKRYSFSKLVIAGGDHGYLRQLQAILKQLGISDKVLFTGFITGQDKWSLYLDSDIFVLPSRSEAFGNVVPEAAFCETPIVLSDGCAISSIVEENDFGIVVPYGDTRQLADALGRIASNDELKTRLAGNAKQYVIDNWTWEKSTSALLDVYSEIMTHRKG